MTAIPIFGTLIKRYKRFMADIELDDGRVITAHCPNSGKMRDILDPGNRVILTQSTNLARKLPFTWEAVCVNNVWIGTNTHRANTVAHEGLTQKKIQPLAMYPTIQREVKYGKNSRIDFLLKGDGLPDCYVEVKNVHLIRQDGKAEFPDCVTERGAKHMGELAAMVQAGFRCVVLYIVQRNDATHFDVAYDLDKTYGEAALAAKKVGVEAMAYTCHIHAQQDEPFQVLINQHLPLLMGT